MTNNTTLTATLTKLTLMYIISMSPGVTLHYEINFHIGRRSFTQRSVCDQWISANTGVEQR